MTTFVVDGGHSGGITAPFWYGRGGDEEEEAEAETATATSGDDGCVPMTISSVVDAVVVAEPPPATSTSAVLATMRGSSAGSACHLPPSSSPCETVMLGQLVRSEKHISPSSHVPSATPSEHGREHDELASPQVVPQ